MCTRGRRVMERSLRSAVLIVLVRETLVAREACLGCRALQASGV
jgi:hypothetical protein